MKKDSLIELLLPLALILGLVLLLSMNVATVSEAAGNTPLDALLKLIVGYLASGAEIAAAVVIGSAVLRGILDYLRLLFSYSRQQHFEATETIRLQLGRVLALGLEFTVASDILHTAVTPTRQDILNLGAIVLLRTLLNYFLEREIQQGERNRHIARQPAKDYDEPPT
ncbi:MAG: DUF1622 domain-containing protein [Chamaesiphon sp.]|nr:DUF1622 domain-containing protein [Chamaesiphon sp.]